MDLVTEWVSQKYLYNLPKYNTVWSLVYSQMNMEVNSLVVEIEMGIGGDHEVELVHCLLVCLKES
jgi:hypothetical protein